MVYEIKIEAGLVLSVHKHPNGLSRRYQTYPARAKAAPVPMIKPVPIAPPIAIMVMCLAFKPRCRLVCWSVDPMRSSEVPCSTL